MMFLESCSTACIDVKPNQVSDHRISPANFSFASSPRFSPFRHINAWSKVDGYKEIIASSWSIVVDGPPVYKVIKKLKELRSNISSWNKNTVGNFHDKVCSLAVKVEASQNLFDIDPLNLENQLLLKSDRVALDNAYSLEESLLRQKSRCSWLSLGDRNSKFFYSSLKTRRFHNSICRLEDDDGSSVIGPALKDLITRFYSNFFDTPQGIRRPIPSGLNFPSHSDEDVKVPCKWVSPSEIEDVVLNSSPDKAPGPNSFNGFFFKENWNVIKNDGIKVVLSFLTLARC